MKNDLFYDGVITIASTRYGGCYENATWMAFSAGVDEIDHEGAFGQDPDCMEWWETLRKNDMTYVINEGTIVQETVYVAIGDTPHKAYKVLLARNKKARLAPRNKSR